MVTSSRRCRSRRDSPDISNASRAIKDSEIETCKKNGVTEITEVKIGYDGIVLANSKADKQFGLTVKTVWLALAKQVPVDGKLVDNPYKNWSEIDSALPILLRFRWSVQADYFADRVSRDPSEENLAGLEHARVALTDVTA